MRATVPKLEEGETLELSEANVERVLDEVRTLSAGCGMSGSLLLLPRSPRPLCITLQVRPYLMADGGNVKLYEIDGLVVRLQLQVRPQTWFGTTHWRC